MEKRVKDIVPGDVIAGAVVLTRPQSFVKTPKGKLEFVVEYPSGKRFVKVWGASTTINTDNVKEEKTGPEAGIIHFPAPEVVPQPEPLPLEVETSVSLAPIDHGRAYLEALADKYKDHVVTEENLEESRKIAQEIEQSRFDIQNWAKAGKKILNNWKDKLEATVTDYASINKENEERIRGGVQAIDNAKAQERARKKAEELAAIQEKLRQEAEERADAERQRLAAIEEEQRVERERLAAEQAEITRRQAELDRQEQERIAAAQAEKDRLATEETARLEKIRQEEKARQDQIKAEDDERKRKNEEAQAELDEIKANIAAAAKAEQDKLAAERKKFEDEQAVIKAAQDAERIAKDLEVRLAREAEDKRLKDEHDALLAEADRLAALAREESLKPDREKLTTWMNGFSKPPYDPVTLTDEGAELYNDILEAFYGFRAHMQAEIDALK